MTRLLVVLGGIIAGAVAAVAVWARKKDELDAEYEASAPERGLTPMPPETVDADVWTADGPGAARSEAAEPVEVRRSPDGSNGAAGTPTPAGSREATTDERADDLQRIKGIGAVSQERLTDEGVTTFAEIAEWDDETLASTAERIRVSAERIRREDWVGQARALIEANERDEAG